MRHNDFAETRYARKCVIRPYSVRASALCHETYSSLLKTIMVELTLQVSNSLAQKIQPISVWLPTIIELSVANFKSSHVKKVSGALIAFLSNNPTSTKVSQYTISEKAQNRVSDLLEINREKNLSSSELKELDEWEKFNHIGTMLSDQAIKLSQ